jgi:hypothetical protein
VREPAQKSPTEARPVAQEPRRMSILEAYFLTYQLK